MTETLPPRTPTPSRTRRSRPSGGGPARAGAVCAAWAVAVGLVLVGAVVLLLWVADSRSGSTVGDALRAATGAFALAHGSALRLPGGGLLALTPLGLLALPLALVARATRAAAERSGAAGPSGTPGSAAAARLVASVALPYALLVGLVALLARGDVVRPSLPQALVGGLVVGLAGGAVGAARAGLLPGGERLPAAVRRAGPPALAATTLLLGAGALLSGVALAAHLGRAADRALDLSPGLAGGLGVLLVGVLLVPTAAVWGTAWLAGPGFAVGLGTGIGPFGTRSGPLPDLPLAGAVPGTPVPGWLGLLALLVPVAAGAVAGRLLARQGGGLRDAALAGPLAGALVGLLCTVSAGALGDGRLQHVGPSGWRVGLCVALEVSLGAAVALRAHRRGTPPDAA